MFCLVFLFECFVILLCFGGRGRLVDCGLLCFAVDCGLLLAWIGVLPNWFGLFTFFCWCFCLG